MNTTKTIQATQLPEALRTIPEAIQASADTTLNLTRTLTLAKALCPVKTGALRETIKIHRPTSNEAYLTAGDATITYAKAVHDGTSNQPPRPFLHQALHAETQHITQEIIHGTVTRL